jgi:hypothetical protein
MFDVELTGRYIGHSDKFEGYCERRIERGKDSLAQTGVYRD